MSFFCTFCQGFLRTPSQASSQTHAGASLLQHSRLPQAGVWPGSSLTVSSAMSTHCKLRASATIVPVATFWLRLRTGKHLPRSQRPYNPGQPDSTPVLLPPLHALLLQQEECSEGRSLRRQACLSPSSPHSVCRHRSLTQPASKEAQLSVKVLVLKLGAPEDRHGPALTQGSL